MSGPDDDRPVEALVDFEYAPDPEFRAAVHRSIDRRVTAGEILRMSTVAVGHVILEFLSLAAESTPSRTPTEE